MNRASDVAKPMPGDWVRSVFKRITGWREFNVVLAVVVLSAILSVSSDVFLTPANLLSGSHSPSGSPSSPSSPPPPSIRSPRSLACSMARFSLSSFTLRWRSSPSL